MCHESQICSIIISIILCNSKIESQIDTSETHSEREREREREREGKKERERERRTRQTRQLKEPTQKQSKTKIGDYNKANWVQGIDGNKLNKCPEKGID